LAFSCFFFCQHPTKGVGCNQSHSQKQSLHNTNLKAPFPCFHLLLGQKNYPPAPITHIPVRFFPFLFHISLPSTGSPRRRAGALRRGLVGARAPSAASWPAHGRGSATVWPAHRRGSATVWPARESGSAVAWPARVIPPPRPSRHKGESLAAAAIASIPPWARSQVTGGRRRLYVCMTGGAHEEVRGLFQKPQHLNQTVFHPSRNNFLKATFLKVTSHSHFYQSHSPTKHTLRVVLLEKLSLKLKKKK
jgi:hypothetical protein